MSAKRMSQCDARVVQNFPSHAYDFRACRSTLWSHTSSFLVSTRKWCSWRQCHGLVALNPRFSSSVPPSQQSHLIKHVRHRATSSVDSHVMREKVATVQRLVHQNVAKHMDDSRRSGFGSGVVFCAARWQDGMIQCHAAYANDKIEQESHLVRRPHQQERCPVSFFGYKIGLHLQCSDFAHPANLESIARAVRSQHPRVAIHWLIDRAVCDPEPIQPTFHSLLRIFGA